MIGYRSTSLGLMSRHCPAAGSHFEHNTPQDREGFAQGVAAHACLQAIAQRQLDAGEHLTPEEVERVIAAAVVSLCGDGHSFEGYREPPMLTDTAWRGAEITRRYLAMGNSIPLGCSPEVGLAVDADWRPVAYDSPNVRVRCIVDLIGPEPVSGEDWLMGEEEYRQRLLVKDWKSSWITSASDLETVQRKIQILIAWAHNGGEYDGIRAVVVNLRTGAEFTIDLYPNEPAWAAVLNRWRGEVEEEMRLRDQQVRANGWRPAIPGAGCYGCPYLAKCEPAQKAIEIGDVERPHAAAQKYAVIEAERERLGKILRAATKLAPIEVNGGEVGYVETSQATPLPGAYGELWRAWIGQRSAKTAEEVEAMARGLLQAMRLGVTQFRKAADARFEDKEQRQEFEALVLGPKIGKAFKVTRLYQDDEAENGESDG